MSWVKIYHSAIWFQVQTHDIRFSRYKASIFHEKAEKFRGIRIDNDTYHYVAFLFSSQNLNLKLLYGCLTFFTSFSVIIQMEGDVPKQIMFSLCAIYSC